MFSLSDVRFVDLAPKVEGRCRTEGSHAVGGGRDVNQPAASSHFKSEFRPSFLSPSTPLLFDPMDDEIWEIEMQRCRYLAPCQRD